MLIRRLFESLAPGCAALALLAGFVLQSSGAPPTSTTVQGVLIDKACSARAESRMVTGVNAHMEGGMLWAYTHDRKCLLMPACQRSGYGVFTTLRDRRIWFRSIFCSNFGHGSSGLAARSNFERRKGC